MLGRGKKLFYIKLLKTTTTRKNICESYHFVLARRRSKPSSRQACMGRIILSKGTSFKMCKGHRIGVHFLTFDFARLNKLLSRDTSIKIVMKPIVKYFINLIYLSRKKSEKYIAIDSKKKSKKTLREKKK